MIRHLRVQNFKSLRDLSLELGQRNVFVGPNMAGKSNILSIFRFLTWMVQPRAGLGGLQGAMNAFGGFTQVAWRGGDSNVISMSLSGDLGGADAEIRQWEYRIELLGNRQQPGLVLVQDENLVLTGPDGRTTLIERDPKSGERILRGHNGDQISSVQDATRSALEFEIPNWLGSALRGFFLSWRFYALRPERMRSLNASAAVQSLSEDGENLSAWLMTLFSKYREIFDKLQVAARDVLPHLIGLYPYPTAQGQVFLASKEKALKSDVPVWQMSDGELCFIALLSLVFAPRELAAPLYCVEEPENHLHPRLLETLMELLRQVQFELAPGNAAQVITVTHSPGLVDKTDVTELHIVDRRDGETICSRPTGRAHLRELLEEAGLGELYFSGALGSV